MRASDKHQTSDFLTVYSVLASQEEAEKVAKEAIAQRLAACVNILPPCRSFFHWDGKVEEAEEVPALFKTSFKQADALIALITKLHSYGVPAITAWPIVKLPVSYADWMTENLG